MDSHGSDQAECQSYMPIPLKEPVILEYELKLLQSQHSLEGDSKNVNPGDILSNIIFSLVSGVIMRL